MSVLICAATVTTFKGAAVCGTAVFAYGAGKELESKKFEKYIREAGCALCTIGI
jgi:hypothetical protein